MDGIHDLGGRQGFGKVADDEPDEAFHAAWEARLFGIVRSMSRPADWSIDWFRHCRELIDPVDYLTRPYYDQWLQTYAAMLINSGIATVEEVASGRSRSAAPDLPPPMPPEAVAAEKKRAIRYDGESPAPPRFKMGETVRAKSWASRGHTRLPQYARGHRGRVTACHGAHVFPDANAHGERRAETLYTVEFDSAELWPEAPARRHRICLDLWESYLEAL